MSDDIWPMVHRERRALIEDLSGIADRDWETPSLCAGWTVHDVAAHLVNNARATRLGFFAELARARFDFDRLNARGVERDRGADPRETLERLRRVASRRSTPPGPLENRILEEILHGEDIRRPLGLSRHYPAEAVNRALRVLIRTPASFGGAKELAERLTLTAVDTEMTVGDGPEARGTALALLLACGRGAALDEIEGPGAEALAERIRKAG